MPVDELIDRLPSLDAAELRRLRAAVDDRLTTDPDGRDPELDSSDPRVREEALYRRMERDGVIVRPNRSIRIPPIASEPPIALDGEPLSEQMLRERR